MCFTNTTKENKMLVTWEVHSQAPTISLAHAMFRVCLDDGFHASTDHILIT